MSSTDTRRVKRFFSYYLSKIIWLLLFAIFFFMGYLLGMRQNAEKLCINNVSKEVQSRTFASKYQTTLLVIVFSAPSNVQRRNTIRKTWFLTKVNNEVTTYFAVGTSALDPFVKKKLNEENKEYNDLLFLPTVSDTYWKLSKKLLEMMLRIDQYFKFSYLLKVDDDTFVRLDALFDELTYKPKEKLYWGFFDGRAKVKAKGKWTEENWNLCSTYLPYAKGGGYILSSDLVQYITQNAKFLTLFKNEDVSVGAWLSSLNIKKIHDPNFDTEYESRGCFNSYLVTHKQSETLMQEKYQNLIDSGNMCKSEQRKRLSYVYNWNVLPHLCCIRNDSRIP